MAENIASFLSELRVGARSLARAKGLTVTVVLTLALGIGANAAMFSLVRAVLLRPLVNRDEDHLIYIRQSAPGMGDDNSTFSVPEIMDLSSRLKTLTSFGDFSTLGFTLTGLGEPRTVTAGVVGGSYFQTMGLRPVLGRLLDAHDDGPNAAGAVVLTYRFWTTALKSDPTVLGKTVRLGSFLDTRPATVVGVLEPCVPYPQDTEIIANIVTSSHHLSATMVTGRIHRMTELFARLAPGADLETARTELQTVYAGMKREHPDAYPAKADYRVSAVRLRDELTSGARTILLVLMAASVLVFIIACSNVANLILARTVRREGELGIRAALGASTGALRRTLLTESLLLCVGGAALGILIARPDGRRSSTLHIPIFRTSPGPHAGFQHALGGRRTGRAGRIAAGIRSASAVLGRSPGIRPGQRNHPRHRNRESEIEDLRRGSDRRFVRAGGLGRRDGEDAAFARVRADRFRHAACALQSTCP